jgi:cell division septation protein DedD
MNDLARIRKEGPCLRKMGIVCAAASLALTLSACGDRNLSETFAAIKAIQVDDGCADKACAQNADARKISGDDLKLVYATARDIAVGQGGLLTSKDGAKPRRLAIDVVDPLKLPPPDDGGPLRVLPADIAAAARLQAARDLPDVPVDTGDAPAPQPAPQPAPEKARFEEDAPSAPPAKRAVATRSPEPASLPATAGQAAQTLIQIGSFSNIDAARKAWDDLQVRYPVALRYKARFQPITTADGRAMVRLKLGPVAPAQAAAVCQALAVRDSWCVRSAG